MTRRIASGLLLAVAVLGLLLGEPLRTVAASPSRPDIVLFYIDDWAPYPGRLWNVEKRTPELARFSESGLVFRNASASTPLCGPARANLLTGKWGHRNGVTQNSVAGYGGSEAISARLRGVGYRTAFIGKHLNGLSAVYPTRERVGTLAQRWSWFDVIWHNQGRFYDWR